MLLVEADDAYVFGHAIAALDEGFHGSNSHIVKDGDVALGKGLARIN